jgi:predicted DNA-binding protein (MmcQ/YjbR family)
LYKIHDNDLYPIPFYSELLKVFYKKCKEMNVEEVRGYCFSKKGAIEGFPFDDTTLVVKVGAKIFALLNLDGPPSINLKCDPAKALELREICPFVIPGYHMNKKHWNTVLLDGSLPNDLIISMLDHSYELVFNSLPEKIRKEISLI